jgi:hypothetical protein
MMRIGHCVATTLRKCVVGGIVFALVSTALPACLAADPTVWKIEEEWEMVINEPDSPIFSPQVTFFTSPSASLDETYFQLQMNYAADAEFSGGGFHVASVQNEANLDEARSETRSILATDGDHIRWTSVMAVIQNKALFAVKNGQGTEWGNFGGPEYLVRMTPSPVSDLSGYNPQQSLDTVDIGFGANRVQSITLLQVRFFYDDGQTVTVPVNRQP